MNTRRQPPGLDEMPNCRELYLWIEANRPDLHERLSFQPMLAVLRILNEETGLSIEPVMEVELTAPLFLEALKAKAMAS